MTGCKACASPGAPAKISKALCPAHLPDVVREAVYMETEKRLSTPQERRQMFLSHVSEMRYFDDAFMTNAFTDPATVQVLLEAIFEEPLEIQRVETQYTQENLYARGVRMDVLTEFVRRPGEAEPERGVRVSARLRVFADLEIQRSPGDATPRRSRLNASMLDMSISDKGAGYDDLAEAYVIFIMEHDIFRHGLQMYHVERVIRELNRPFDDGQYIIYVNGACQPDTPLGRIMHDFYCQSPNDMYTRQLADRMRELKSDTMEVQKMCDFVQRLYANDFEYARDIFTREGEQKGRQEGRQEGVQEGMEKKLTEVVRSMHRECIPLEVIAAVAKISVAQVQEILGRDG